jgi:hypothetical protein
MSVPQRTQGPNLGHEHVMCSRRCFARPGPRDCYRPRRGAPGGASLRMLAKAGAGPSRPAPTDPVSCASMKRSTPARNSARMPAACITARAVASCACTAAAVRWSAVLSISVAAAVAVRYASCGPRGGPLCSGVVMRAEPSPPWCREALRERATDPPPAALNRHDGGSSERPRPGVQRDPSRGQPWPPTLSTCHEF